MLLSRALHNAAGPRGGGWKCNEASPAGGSWSPHWPPQSVSTGRVSRSELEPYSEPLWIRNPNTNPDPDR